MDLDPSSVTSGGWLEDTSLVEKYTISEEAYDKLDGKFWQNFVMCTQILTMRVYISIIPYDVSFDFHCIKCIESPYC